MRWDFNLKYTIKNMLKNKLFLSYLKILKNFYSVRKILLKSKLDNPIIKIQNNILLLKKNFNLKKRFKITYRINLFHK
jgi:hypothetical protein